MSPELRVGVEEGGVTALTWGVFPNREILLQTTANYLFQMHSLFGQKSILTLEYDVAQLYEYDSASYKLIETIRDTYFLVAIIDNDFSVGGDMFT